MDLRYTLAATTAVVFLMAGGFVQAQQNSPGTGGGTETMPSERQTTPPTTRDSMPGKSSGAFDSSSLSEVTDDTAMVKSLNVSAKELADMEIYGSDDKKIGEIDKVLADSSGDVKAVTADVGGFLGIGSREVLVSIDKLQKGAKKDQLRTSMTQDEIQNLSEYRARASSSPDRSSPGPSSPGISPSPGDKNPSDSSGSSGSGGSD